MTPEELGVLVCEEPALRDAGVLVLHGSRTRGDAGPDADRDLAVLPVPGTSPDLATASALLRFRAARDGVVVVEREPGLLLRFRQEAVRFWCDAGPVIRAAQDDVLARLG